ncbi:hypothetical protein ASPCAL06384 [Aspergillus calidoustus]|uniref:MARVEL domain-containing protein n=1 Tax=Aspergillus calidoustus TaxID=454130 RepID=A0A0U5FZX6_ASPCI|nr:hypothetical protein ASPCAL06384 [Aspergillus calidoustus]
MRRKSVKPSEYPALPFHLVRFFLFASSIIVGIILAAFAVQLHNADHRLPWAFLVLIIAAFLSLLNLTLTTILHCCYGLSPRLSLITNTIVFIIWAIALVLLSWSLSHTILTTCNSTYWGTSTGITVCRIFKALFTFTIIGTALLIASIGLDIFAYRRTTRLGEYDPMAAEGHNLAEYKAGHARDSSVLSGSFPHPNAGVAEDDRSPLVSGGYGGAGHMRGRSEEDIGETRPLHQPPPYNSSTALEGYSDQPGQQRHSRGRSSVYDNPGYGYGHHNEQTAYDPLAYR